MNEDRVTGWWIFAGILLFIGGILNIIWGIAAIGESHFFVGEYHFIISSLENVGLDYADHRHRRAFRRVFAVRRRRVRALDRDHRRGTRGDQCAVRHLAYPIWSLCIFILALVILYELAKAPAARTQA